MDVGAARGQLDAMILAVLEAGPAHGYGVIESLRARSAGELDLPSGTVYPALRRLERHGYVTGKWGVVGGRERRTYRLTARGRAQLRSQRAAWSQYTTVIGAVLGSDRG